MRLAIAAAALILTAEPGLAGEKPSADEFEAMFTYTQAIAAGAFCQDYRINSYQLGAYLKSHGFDSQSVQKKYPDYYEDLERTGYKGDPATRKRTCEDYFDKMGNFGIYPHILVRR